VAKLNASEEVVDEMFQTASQLASQVNDVNASITAAEENVTALETAQDSNSLRVSQLRSACQY